MEHKIGEIFEYNGGWYQCVEGGIYCPDCVFFRKKCNSQVLGECGALTRSDKENVIFKKLEKVGEPFTGIIQEDERVVWMQEYKLYDVNFCKENALLMYVSDYKHKRIAIEIEQNKEDMEEKKQCGDNRFRAIARAKEHLFQATNIAEDKKELEVLDSFLLRCWQMGWLKQYEDGEEKKLNLKPFDIQKAREGKPVYTRDGRKARILCYDFKQNEEYPILVAVENKDGKECALLYSNDGISEMYKSSNNELAMLPEKKEGWVNVYKERIYSTKEEAIEATYDGVTYIDTVKISWEE